MRNGNSFVDLLKDLAQQSKTFVREEFQLAKTEMAEKASALGKNATTVAIGGFVAYGGLIVFLGGLGMLLAFVFERLGLQPALAAFMGLGVIGLVVIGVGVIFLLKGITAFSKESLTPKRTIGTLRRGHLTENGSVSDPEPTDKKDKARTSEEIEACVMATEDRMAETVEELTERVTLNHFRQQASDEVRKHPYRYCLLAIGGGMAASYLVTRKFVRKERRVAN